MKSPIGGSKMSALYLNNRLLNENIKLLIFDKDGTLIDLHYYWTEMINVRARKLCTTFFSNELGIKTLQKTMGLSQNEKYLKPEGPIGAVPRAKVVEIVTSKINELLHSSVEEYEVEDIFRQADEETSKDIEKYLRVLPGVQHLLETCKQKGVKTAVATSDITSRAEIAMDVLGLKKYFDFIIGSDQVVKGKPDPEMGEKILREFNISPLNTAMIGDHMADINMGKACSIHSLIAVATGLISYDNFNPNGFEVVNTLDEVKIQ